MLHAKLAGTLQRFKAIEDAHGLQGQVVVWELVYFAGEAGPLSLKEGVVLGGGAALSLSRHAVKQGGVEHGREKEFADLLKPGASYRSQ